MEISDIYSAGNSLRSGNSLTWRNSNGGNMFSLSFREEDDEEALKWAAIEKMPTYDRLRKGLLTSLSGGKVNEVDIRNLGFQERRNLLERLVRTTEEDNEKFLLNLKSRIDRVGIEIPTIEVRFEHLTVEAEGHVGSRAVPTFFNYFVNMIEDLLNLFHVSNKKKHSSILKDVSGIIKPSRMTLLLGPPNSGKTTLLLALAGRLDPSLKFSGRVTHNGHGMDEFIPQRTAAYINQHDLHIGEMTVRETLSFSARCQGVGARFDLLAELARREKAANIIPDSDIDVFMKAAGTEGQEASVVTDYVLKVLGLEGCADTFVGDDMTRGISGGQKKRVTTGEILVGPASALFMDEISTGLDSSTTYQIVNSLKQSIQILNGTAIISLLQPAPETYDLFDDIILLSDGLMVYQGPRQHVLEFFEFMGFKCPERKGVADFLQEVTSKKDQMQYWVREQEPYRFISSKEFAEAFESFPLGRRLAEELATPFDKAKSHPAALTTSKYGVNKKGLLKACFSREYLLMKRNSFVYIFKFFQLTFMSVITMTIFLRTEMHRDSVVNGGIYAGALFLLVVMVLFNGMSEIPLTIAKLPVFFKQRDLRFFPAWAYALPTWILKIPITFLDIASSVFITYYVIGFDPDAGRFFKQYLLFILLNQMASGVFRAIAAIGRNLIMANTFGSFVLLMFFLLGGFILSRDDIKKWWIWGYWLSPMMYGQNAVLVNEFLGKSWGHVLPNSTEPLGIAVLKSRGFFTEAYWYWLGVGATIGFTLVFNFLFALALTFLGPLKGAQAIISEDPGENRTQSRDEITRNSSLAGSSSNNNDKGMILPFEPHFLTFDEIEYSVDMPEAMKLEGVLDEKLVLLKGVSGSFRPGVLTALMGVSGAGKTTLMDVLAGRKTGGYITGNITVSGYPKKQETFARISGYCEQNDIHSPHVTVYESLLFSAWLRLPAEVDTKTRKIFIEEIMELVELYPLRQALVGFPGVDGLSTEQRKRLTIAVELVANPSIIFMDEPTSGLDARAAAIVMRTVRNTVDTGRTVVCTIHQPSIDIFEAFDELFLLKRGGQELYVGPLGHHSCHLIKYFEIARNFLNLRVTDPGKAGLSLDDEDDVEHTNACLLKMKGIRGVSKIKSGYNPATWMLEVTTAAQEIAFEVDFADIYKNSEVYRRNKALIKDLSTPPPGSKDLYFPNQYSLSFSSQFLACLWKQHLSYWRNPPYTAVRFLFTTFIGLIFGTVFWDLGSKLTKQQDLFNAMGSMYTSVLFIGIQNASSVQPVVSVERTVFYRERAAGMYSAMPYAFGQATIEVPYVFAQTVVYAVIVYAMMGFEWSASKFFWYLFFMYFTFLYFTFYGMMALAISPNHQIASIISTGFYSIWNLFSGFIIPRPRTPVWWRWNCYICPVAWTLYGVIASQFGDLKDTTLENGITVEQFVKDYYDFKHDFIGAVAAFVVGFTVLFAFMFAVSIKLFNFQRR